MCQNLDLTQLALVGYLLSSELTGAVMRDQTNNSVAAA